MITHPLYLEQETIIEEAFEGFNSCIMAYGQTGSGKTHTIFGSVESIESIGSGGLHPDLGLVPRIVQGIFDYLEENTERKQFRISVSFLQIYLENITDLLAPN